MVSSTAVRAKSSLQQAEAAVQEAIGLARHSAGDELVAAEIRIALDQLGRVVGTIYADDVLDVVFGRFCIGK